MTSVLVIDDDSALLRALAITLRARGFTVTTAADGTTALSIAAGAAFDLIVLDLGLPDIDGLDLVEALRGWVVAPIIVLSARDSQAVKVDALDAGADDYVTKPFGMDELLARMRAALRRATPDPPAPVITTADFSVDLALKRIVREGAVIRLTPTEWSLLEVLVRNAGRLVSQQQLLREVWGPGYESETHYLRVYVAQLRAKLEPDPPNPRYLVTEPGMGYRFVP